MVALSFSPLRIDAAKGLTHYEHWACCAAPSLTETSWSHGFGRTANFAGAGHWSAQAGLNVLV